jgi:hypothetical protein
VAIHPSRHSGDARLRTPLPARDPFRDRATPASTDPCPAGGRHDRRRGSELRPQLRSARRQRDSAVGPKLHRTSLLHLHHRRPSHRRSSRRMRQGLPGRLALWPGSAPEQRVGASRGRARSPAGDAHVSGRKLTRYPPPSWPGSSGPPMPARCHERRPDRHPTFRHDPACPGHLISCASPLPHHKRWPAHYPRPAEAGRATPRSACHQRRPRPGSLPRARTARSRICAPRVRRCLLLWAPRAWTCWTAQEIPRVSVRGGQRE